MQMKYSRLHAAAFYLPYHTTSLQHTRFSAGQDHHALKQRSVCKLQASILWQLQLVVATLRPGLSDLAS